MNKFKDINSGGIVGIKLDIGFSVQESYRELYGNHSIPEYLAELGFTTVETPIGLETDGEALKQHVVCCCNAGLKTSLHAYSENTASNPAFFSLAEDNACRSFHQRFLSLAAEVSCLQHSPTVVNIHPAAGGSDDSRRDLVDRSASFFSWAHEWCYRNAPEVHLVAELQISPDPEEPIQRIGDTYDELLEVITRSQIQACWDFGHAYLNERRYDVQLYPPEGFLPHVGHVHCHDAYGDDHHPLVYNTVPWKKFSRLLINSGFNGSVILEVPPSKFLSAGGIQSLTHSLKALETQIKRCKGGQE
jgi:sugar phosphate isomerase/epimerase